MRIQPEVGTTHFDNLSHKRGVLVFYPLGNLDRQQKMPYIVWAALVLETATVVDHFPTAFPHGFVQRALGAPPPARAKAQRGQSDAARRWLEDAIRKGPTVIVGKTMP